MTGRGKRVSAWQQDAKVITRKYARESPSVRSLEEVCAATGLKPSALLSYVHRTGTVRRDVPRSHLVRPAYRVGETPYWSQQQVDAYHEAMALRSERRQKALAGLPTVTQRVADERGWWSLRRLADWSGYALVTLHRLASEEGFPEPVAALPSPGTRPYVLRDREAVAAFLRARDPGWAPKTGEEGS